MKACWILFYSMRALASAATDLAIWLCADLKGEAKGAAKDH